MEIFKYSILSSISDLFNKSKIDNFKSSLNVNFSKNIHGKDVILVACDEVYFWRYAVSFIKSLSMIEDTFYVHIHLILPNEAIMLKIEKLRQDFTNIVLSFTADPMTGLTLPKRVNIYYNCARFIVADQLLDYGVKRLLILDVDTIARTSPWEKLNRLAAKGAFNFRPTTRKPWHRILANAVYYENSDVVRVFSKRFARTLLAVLAKNPNYHIDQIIPHYLLTIGTRRLRRTFTNMPADVMSLTYDPASSLWTAKGSDKHSSKFLNEKNKIDTTYHSEECEQY